MEADTPGGHPAVQEGRSEALSRGADVAERLRRNVESVVIGKREQVDLVLTALACRGHVLLEDVPGTAKTVLARALSGSIDAGAASRIQCTPDLQPTDVTGLLAFDPRTREFEFRPGPVFANVLLVDEINRAMPKTQSALLEAMAESQVTVDGVTRPLPDPFLLLATENPIEQEGTFPLPEAQLDRFFLRTSLGYPQADEELRIVQEQHGGHPLTALAAVVSADDVWALQRAVEDVYVDELLQRWIVALVRATRGLDFVAVGASVRGSLALERAVRAWALVHGRSHAEADDVERLFGAVILHRLLLEPASLAEEEVDATELGRRVWRRCLEVAPRPEPGLERGGAGRRMSPQRAFPLVPRRRLLGLPFGDRRSLRRGVGSEVVGSRAYRRGDPVSSIDWPASARLSALRGQDELIVRQYVAEEAPSVVVVLDRRPSMALYDASLPFLHKAAAVERAVEAIVASAAAARAPIGLVEAAEGRVRLLTPSRSDPRLVLRRVAEAPFEAPEHAVEESLALLARRRGELPAGTFVFVLSDFLSPLAATAWGRLRGLAWDVVPVVFQDPTFERSFPVLPSVLVPYADPATGAVRQVRLRRREAAALRREHEERFAVLLERLRGAGADPVVIDSDASAEIDQAFASWAERRQRRVRRLR